MGNTASTLQPPDGDRVHGIGPGGIDDRRSRSPSVRRALGREHGSGSVASSLSLAASSTLQYQQRMAAMQHQQRLAAQKQAQPGYSAQHDRSHSGGSGGTVRREFVGSQSGSNSRDPSRSPGEVYAPLPRLSHPHPQSHAYAFANQASLEPGLSAVHQHPFSQPSSPAGDLGGTSPGALAEKTPGRARSGSVGLADRAAGDEIRDELSGSATRSRSVRIVAPSAESGSDGTARGVSPSGANRRSASVSSPAGQASSGNALLSGSAHPHSHHYSHLHQPSPLRTELAVGNAHGSSRRRTHEGVQLGMGFDPTTVVSSHQAPPLVATQNRHASGTPSHLEPQHPSTVFSSLDVRGLEAQSQPSPESGSFFDRPKFVKRESGSGTPTQTESDPFKRAVPPALSQPVPVPRSKETEASFGIGDGLADLDTTFGNGAFGLGVPTPIAAPGSSAITDDDLSSPPEPMKDPLGRTLPAALPSYLRIPTTDMVNEDSSLDYLNLAPASGEADEEKDDRTSAEAAGADGKGNTSTGSKRTSGIGGVGVLGSAGPGAAGGYRTDHGSAVPFMAILLTWRGGGHNVSVTGTFANTWRSLIPLSRNTSGSKRERSEFSCLLHLPPGTHRLKFLVDDRWRVSPDLSTATDGEGNLVNYVEIPNVGPDHTGPLSAPGEDLPDEAVEHHQRGGLDPKKTVGAGEEDFKFPSAVLRASRLGKFGLGHLPEPGYGLQSPPGGRDHELASDPASARHHGKEASNLSDDAAGLSLEEQQQRGRGTDHEKQQQQQARRDRTPSAVADDRASHYAESTTSSGTGASSGMTASMHHNDLKITPLDARGMDLDDDRPRPSLDEVFAVDQIHEKKKKAMDTWTREIPEDVVQAQIAEELERDRLDALAESGAPPQPQQQHGHGHGHGHGHMPAPPSLPRQLEKVILNSGPSGLAGSVDDNSVLPAPNHVVLSHLTASSIRGGVLAVGTTTRYKRKYVTTVYHRPVK